MIDTTELAPKYALKPFAQLSSDRQIHVVRYSPCGKFLVGGDYEGQVRRWKLDDTGAHQPIAALTGHHGWVQALGFGSHSSEQILFTSDSWGRLCAWNYAEETPEPLWSHETAHDGWIRGLTVSPDGLQLATCGNDRRIRLWSSVDGKLLREFPEQPEQLFSVEFHPAGEWLVSGDLKGAVHVWDVAAGTSLRQIDAGALYKYDRIQDIGGVWSLRFDTSGATLFCAGVTPDRGATVQGPPTILVFDFATGTQREAIQLGSANHCYVHDLFWHADGFLVAVTSGTPGSGQLLFHRPGEEKPFYLDTKIANAHGVSLHPGGQRLAVVSTNKGSNGNGRPLDKEGNYIGNTSPVQVFEITAG